MISCGSQTKRNDAIERSRRRQEADGKTNRSRLPRYLGSYDVSSILAAWSRHSPARGQLHPEPLHRWTRTRQSRLRRSEQFLGVGERAFCVAVTEHAREFAHAVLTARLYWLDGDDGAIL